MVGRVEKKKKAQARVHLGQSRLRVKNCNLREGFSIDANWPRLIIIRRDSVRLIATEDSITPRGMPQQRPCFKTINTCRQITAVRNAAAQLGTWPFWGSPFERTKKANGYCQGQGLV